jgi:myo-inositol 2-dehydrogenase/D-chiro-inositol 1-dehydrogenase
VDAVVVASVDSTHEKFVRALHGRRQAGAVREAARHHAGACMRIIEEEVAGGRRLVHLGFQRRYDPAYVAVKRTLDDGTVGDVLMIHCAHRNASVPPTFTSDMLITSSVVHEIDASRWLLGEEIVAATVHTPRSTSLAASGLQDSQLVLLESEGGVLIDVEIFANAGYGYDIRCELVGESGTVSLADHGGTQVAPDFHERFAAAYARELDAWVRALDGGPQFGPSAWDAYAAVADACLESQVTGRRAEVRLERRPDLYA